MERRPGESVAPEGAEVRAAVLPGDRQEQKVGHGLAVHHGGWTVEAGEVRSTTGLLVLSTERTFS